jgi:hypothetical protein
MEQSRINLFQGLRLDGSYSKGYDEFTQQYFSNEQTVKNLWNNLINNGEYTRPLKDFYSKYCCDLGWSSNLTFCGGTQTSGQLKKDNVVTPPPATSEDFPPCATKLGKVRKTPSGVDVIVYKSTAWDKPNVQLYSKSNRFIVLGGSEKGKMGNYKCTESGKLFLELDSEKKVDPKKDDNKKQGLTSTNLTSDDILNGKGSVKIGMKGKVVGEIQNLLISKGFKEVSKTGNADNTFGPLTDKMVREFQTKNGLTVDGIVGPNTWSKLSKNSVETKTEPVDMSQPVTTPGAPGYKAPLNLDVNRPNTQLSEIKKIVSKNLKSLIK